MPNNLFHKKNVIVNGSSTSGGVNRSAGYVNWIADNVRRSGQSVNNIAAELNATAVQLSYPLAGYTTKEYLTLLAEQSSPESTVNGIVIPDDDYTIFLRKGQPIRRIVYSAVIVKKTNLGYSVAGYDTANPYFTIVPSQISSHNYAISVGDVGATVYQDYESYKIDIPYGYEFTSVQQVVDFLVSYQRYLVARGMVFTQTSSTLKDELNFILSAREFLTWHQQGWNEDDAIVLSPVADTVTVNLILGTTDQLRNSALRSRVLDQNFSIVPANSIDVNRYDNTTVLFCRTITTIGLVVLDIVEYEHALVLNNQTRFKDIVYQPELGNRQARLKILGTKTAEWTGTLGAPGFIVGINNIVDWVSNTQYLTGDIVKYKFFYYVALENSLEVAFNYSQWKQLDADILNKTLLPNLTTAAAMSKSYYDIDQENLNASMEQHAKGLIGFRSRSYFSNLGVELIPQTKFYQGFIRGKGTSEAITILKNVSFGRLSNIVDFYEDWAFRVGEYGGTDVNQYIEVNLQESYFTLNPGVGEIVDTAVSNPTVQQITPASLYKKPYGTTTDIFLTQTTRTGEDLIRSAGYVDPADVTATVFDIQNIINTATLLDSVYDGAVIWCALDYTRDWNVFRVTNTALQFSSITNLLNGYIEIEFKQRHQLTIDDVITVKNFSELFNGFYKVYEVPSLFSIIVTTTADLTGFESAVGSGMLFKLVSLRYKNIENSVNFTPLNNWRENEHIWIDNYASADHWAVLEKHAPWQKYSNSVYNLGTTLFGSVVVTEPTGTYFITNSIATNQIYVYKLAGSAYSILSTISESYAGIGRYGSNLAYNGKILAVVDSTYGAKGAVVIYQQVGDAFTRTQLIPSISASANSYGFSIQLSTNYLAVSSPIDNTVYLYRKDTNAATYTLLQIIDNQSINGVYDHFGYSIEITKDETKIYIGAPYAEVDRVYHAGRVLVYTVRNGVFQYCEKVQPLVPINNGEFGSSLAACSNDCSLFVGSPGVSFDNTYRSGEVYRFVNLGRALGVVKSQTVAGSVAIGSSLIINGVEVPVGGTVYDVAANIQAAELPGITATAANNILTIVSESVIDYSRLYILPGQGNAYTVLGLKIISQEQILANPINRNISKFGFLLALSADNTQLFASSPKETTLLETIFDNGTAVFDDESTIFVDEETNSGGVCVFQYIAPLTLIADNLGSYIFGQQLESTSISAGDEFGCSIAIGGDTVFVGASHDDPENKLNAGTVQLFKNNGNQTLWRTVKSAAPLINVDSINRAYLYNKKTSSIVTTLDIVDPLKGRILGIVREDIDYIENQDPATYNDTSGTSIAGISRIDEYAYWAEDSVGRYWLDTSQLRFIDYEQQSLGYRSSNWSTVFPGSEPRVYQWIKSDVIPSKYSAKYSGVPKYADDSNYTVTRIVDKNTGAVGFTYYYWVRSFDTVPNNKTLSTSTIESYISNPKSSGLPYIAFYGPTAFGLYNVADLVDADNTVLHIEYDVRKNTNIIHAEYELVQENKIDSSPPTRIIKKMIDSLVGYNSINQPVPDPNLSVSERYGLGIRPRQTLFIDRAAALESFVYSANLIFAQLFFSQNIANNTNFNKTQTSTLWEYTTWSVKGFDLNTRPEYVVDKFADLQRRSYLVGTVVKIKDNGTGYYSIVSITSTGYDLLAQEHATIKLLPTVYADSAPAAGVRYILESIFNELFVGDYGLYGNQLFFVLVRYVLIEQKYIDWAFKTSFITVEHTAVTFEQFPNYQPDNQNYLLEYIYEAKPYHTKIRNYLPKYTGVTDAYITVTDFDLPAYYDGNLGMFRSPSGEQPKDDGLLEVQPQYYDWSHFHTLELSSIEIINGGSGYTAPPAITITGGGGTGASAHAVLSGGSIVRVDIVNPGTGYLTAPTVTAAGARLVAIIKNHTVRQFDMVLKYDRIAYNSTGLDGYDTHLFDTEVYDSHDVELDHENALDRVRKNYKHADGAPAKSFDLLYSGIEFPGHRITGTPDATGIAGFNNQSWGQDGWDTGVQAAAAEKFDMAIQSAYSDLALGTRAEDIVWNGNEYVDPYHSHAPEELLPGMMFDTLDLKVVHLPQNKAGRSGNGIPMVVYSFVGTGYQSVFNFSFITTENYDIILVYSLISGRLINNANYTINYTERTITFDSPPPVSDSVFLYVVTDVGVGEIFEKAVVANGATNSFFLPVTYNEAKYVLTLVDGVKTAITRVAVPGGINAVLDPMPAAGQKVHFQVFDSDLNYPTSELTIEDIPVVAGTRTYTLTRPLAISAPRDAQCIVTLDGARLTPTSYSYYYGDGTTTQYLVENRLNAAIADITTVAVLNGVALTLGVHYTTGIIENNYYVIFSTPPAVNSEIAVGNCARRQFYITNSTTLVIDSHVTLTTGSTLSVISFTNHDPLKMHTQVFVGNSTIASETTIGFDHFAFESWDFDSNQIVNLIRPYYHLSRPASDLALLWVTVDGKKLFPGWDYKMYDANTLYVLESVGITSTSVITVTSFTETRAARLMSFRLFKNMVNEYSYYRMAYSNSTYLTRDLLITDTEIHVLAVDRLDEPDPAAARPGVVFIHGERITYFGKDTVNNTLTQIRRSTGGTGAPAVHESGRQVIGASGSQLIANAHNKIWYQYDVGYYDVDAYDSVDYDRYELDHTGLENQTTAPALFLKEQEGLFLDR